MKESILTVIVIGLSMIFTSCKQKEDISILFVGNSPDVELTEETSRNIAWTDSDRFAEEVKTRMPAFLEYLKNYFTEVEGVDVNDYSAEMSDSFDVTIFDEVVKPIKERVYVRDPETGQTLKYEPAHYLPEDYDSPTLFIGHTADRLGRPLGSKLDWYCLCLTKWAHTVRTDHQIFKGPFKVDITMKDRPTPLPILKSWDGGDMPAEIPMWTVNTEDYTDEKGYRIGMVSRGWGFEDSPDAEYISSGQCDKQKTAVSIGRHGNFFLWGFAGSPDYMTEEAKQVFANAIVYTYKHRNDRRIAKKYNDRIATKIYLEELLFYITPRAYKEHVKVYEGFNAESLKAKEEAIKKKEAGEDLSDRDKMMLNFEPQPISTWEQYIEKNIGRQGWGGKFGTDTAAIRKFIVENRPYFFSEPDGFYDLRIDEDCKSLGIANTDIDILDKAISMLEENENNAKAKRLLYRYTIEDKASASEWRSWFEANRDNMFFTEAGGYVWLINDPDANPDTRPRNEKDIVPMTELRVDVNKPTDTDPVSVGVVVVKGSDAVKRTVIIKTNIREGYHIYAYVPSTEAYIVTKPGLELPEGVKKVGEWQKPSPNAYPGKESIMVYKDENLFKQEIELGENFVKGSQLKITFYYQACDSKICFPPKTKEFIIGI